MHQLTHHQILFNCPTVVTIATQLTIVTGQHVTRTACGRDVDGVTSSAACRAVTQGVGVEDCC